MTGFYQTKKIQVRFSFSSVVCIRLRDYLEVFLMKLYRYLLVGSSYISSSVY